MWLSGYDSYAGFDSTTGLTFGTTKIDFNSTPVLIDYDSLAMNFDATNSSYCNNDGELLFYTNGVHIANAYNEKIENSDSINWGWVSSYYAPDIYKNGFPFAQGTLILNRPNSTSEFFILSAFPDSMGGTNNIYIKRISYALLDMNANNGHGFVPYKNTYLFEDNISGEISATRHANGRDWWIITQKRNSNCFYRTYLSPSGPALMQSFNCLGDTMYYGSIGASCFSPDGSKYVYLDLYQGLHVYDFDRCNGELLNAKQFAMPIYKDSSWLGRGVAISSNNRFLYVCATKYLYQFDLWESNLIDGIDTIAVYDGHKAPFGSFFNTAQIAPDGKIYISCGNGETNYHIINNPDGKGTNCNFQQHSVQLLTPSAGVPNFPNYRLGPLLGSPCDTLGLGIAQAEKEKQLTIYPNPASDYITIDYGNTNWAKGNVDLEILNALGQIVYAQTLPSYSGFQKVDVSYLPQGYYAVQLKRNAVVVAGRPFVKE